LVYVAAMSLIDWPTFEPTAEDLRILKAFRDQEPIEINGEMCLVIDAHYPRLSDKLSYTTRPF
jgi:hypothetical protein